MKTHGTVAALSLSLLFAACGSPTRSSNEFDPSFPMSPRELPADEPAALVAEAIEPAFASPAMRVTITGSGFDSGVRVLFGGIEGEIVSIHADRVVVHPAAGGLVDETGTTAVTVVSGDRATAALPIRIGSSGDHDAIDTRPHFVADDVVGLEGGTFVFADAAGSRLHRIDADGWVSAFSSDLLAGPRSLAATPAGTVLAFQAEVTAVVEVDPSTGIVTPWADPSYGWIAGSFHGTTLYALRSDKATLDRVLVDGSVTPFASLGGNCPDSVDIAVSGDTLYAATWYGAVCRVDLTSGVAEEVTLSGADPASIRRIDGTNGGIVAVGTLYGGTEAVFTIDAAGAVTDTGASFEDSNVAVARGSDGRILVSTMGGAVAELGAAGLVLRAAPVVGIGDLREIDGRRYATAGNVGVPAFVAELSADGRYRIAANAQFSALWLSLAAEGDDFLVADYQYGRILRVEAGTGVSSMVVDHGAIGPVSAFLRDASGRFLVASWMASTSIARYGADGLLENEHFVTGIADTAFSMTAFEDTLYITDGDDVMTSSLSEGGQAVPVRPNGMAPTAYGLLGIAADSHDGTVYVADGNDSGMLFRVAADGGLAEVGFAGAAIGLDVDSDGAILVADLAGIPYRILP